MNKTYAYIGIIAVFSMAICDIILLGQPVSGSQYDMSSYGAMEHVSHTRAAIGAGGGLLCSFFVCFGFWFQKELFEPVNSKLAGWLFIFFSSMMFFGGAFHAGYFFLTGLQNDAPILHQFRTFLEILSYFGVVGFVGGTIVFFRLASDNRFPKYARFTNPTVLCALLLGVFYLLPAPIGGFVKPTFVNLSTGIMLLVSLRMAQGRA